MDELRFRQIHLDFHTSEHIANIGDKFDPDVFADTLVKASVNSITCFARCHHGWIYYDTKRNPERRHPHLTRNLLKEQIEACHARGIRVPIYTTIQWDHFTANANPEWLAITSEGRVLGHTPSPFQAGFYRFLCVNSPYMDFLKAHVEEIFEMLPVDGLFFDIVQPLDDASRWTREGMLATGLDPSDADARKAYGIQVITEFQRELSAFVRSINPEVSIFYNSGHVGPRHREIAETFSHFEIESLPSGFWGYTHFPLAARYGRTLGLDVMGMTGKFHTSWGDFHSFKNQAALEFECFHMLAMGAKCSIGDQLHPEGDICQTTYKLIGSVYSQVAEKEAWCVGATPVAEIAVMTPEEWTFERQPASAVGAMRMLQEAGHQFDVADTESEFTRYRLLILPDNIPVNDALAAKISAYLAQGGAVIASYESGRGLGALGIAVKGSAPYSPDFIIPTGEIGAGLPEIEHVLYMRGMQVEAQADTEILARAIIPYFNRTYSYFCSHLHTPSSGEAAYPAITRRGQAIYFAHPIFTQYQENAPRWCRQLVLNAINMLMPDRLIQHDGPSTMIAILNEQAAQQRRILHALHYIPVRTNKTLDIIEDVIPLHNITFRVRDSRPVRAVVCVPQQIELLFTQAGNRVEFTLPYLDGHQMVALIL